MPPAMSKVTKGVEKNEKLHGCPYRRCYPEDHDCYNVKKTRKLLCRHILRIHIKHLSCGKCGKRFGSPGDLQRHEDKHCNSGPSQDEPLPECVLELEQSFRACKNIGDLKKTLFVDDKPVYDYVQISGAVLARSRPFVHAGPIEVTVTPVDTVESSSQANQPDLEHPILDDDDHEQEEGDDDDGNGDADADADADADGDAGGDDDDDDEEEEEEEGGDGDGCTDGANGYGDEFPRTPFNIMYASLNEPIAFPKKD